MLASGVRSSWVTLETKSFLARAKSRSRVMSWSTATTPAWRPPPSVTPLSVTL